MSTTLTYARVHNHKVADDYFTAMAKVEKKLEQHLQKPSTPQTSEPAETAAPNHKAAHLLTLVAALQTELLPDDQRTLVAELHHGLKALAKPARASPKQQIVNEQPGYSQLSWSPP